MEQLKIFATGNDLDTEPALKSHAGDPTTSRAAAASHAGRAASNMERCVDAVYVLYHKETGGPTNGEIWDWLSDEAIDYHEVARRMPEARDEKKVRSGPARKCKVRNKKCQTWEPL